MGYGDSACFFRIVNKISLNIIFCIFAYDFDGIFADEKTLGKPTDSDIKEGKNTIIIKKFLDKSDSSEKKRFYSFFGKPNLKEEDLVWYKKTLVKYEIDEEIKKQIKKNTRLYF
jgi:geranylgeranyl pyrophosphate synthase